MNVRESWNQLCEQMKDENPEASQALFKIHMGAFDDIRRNGHRITANGQSASIVAASLSPDERFTMICDLGRQMTEASSALINGRFGERCVIRHADHFPHCIFIGLAAILHSIGSGLSGQKLLVLCEYETEEESGDPLGALLPTLQSLFPWTEIKKCARTVKASAPAPAPQFPMDRMDALFEADGATRLDVGRVSFSGTVTRGSIRKGDVVHVVDRSGIKIAPDALVMYMIEKEAPINGDMNTCQIESIVQGQHVVSIVLAVQMPSGPFNGIFLAKETADSPAEEKQEAPAEEKQEAPVPPQAAQEKSNESQRGGFFPRLFGKKKG